MCFRFFTGNNSRSDILKRLRICLRALQPVRLPIRNLCILIACQITETARRKSHFQRPGKITSRWHQNERRNPVIHQHQAMNFILYDRRQTTVQMFDARTHAFLPRHRRFSHTQEPTPEHSSPKGVKIYPPVIYNHNNKADML